MYLSTRAPGSKPLGAIAPSPASGFQKTARLAGLPSGRAGTLATLNHMRDFVRASIRSPEQIVRERALRILDAAGVPQRKYWQSARALHAFVRDEIKYVRDPVGVELVQTPEKTLQLGYGDCDDKSTLLAALLESTGHPARFTVIAFGGNPFSHVLAETRLDNRWVPAETIIPKPLGWFPTGVTEKYSRNIR